ncbi:MAG: hypothetical protein ACO1OB_29625 [Archangium sp.]
MRFVALLIALSTLAGCRRETPVEVQPDVRATQASLDFGAVAIGATHVLTLEVSNFGGAQGEVSLAVDAPFSLDVTTVSLRGGESATVTITFTPTAVGPVSASLNGLPVTLTAEGLPACVASVCRSNVFSLSTRRCEETELDDASACGSACLDGPGECRAGQCVGSVSASCDDGDLCTVDACSNEGQCVHPPVPLPTRGACEVSVCDPARGVTWDNVEDGTLCGAPTCETARLCINGECVARPTANSADDCRYTPVCTYGSYDVPSSYGSAATRSGKLRCWGNPEMLRRDAGFSLPAEVPGATDVGRPVCLANGPSWLDRSGHWLPVNRFADAGFETYRDVRPDTFSTGSASSDARVLSTDGRAMRGSFTFVGLQAFIDAGVRELCGSWSYLTDDGKAYSTLISLSSELRLEADGAPVTGCASPEYNMGYVLADGGVHRALGPATLAGAVQLMGSGGVMFVGADAYDYRSRFLVRWPFVPMRVTDDRGQLCGVSDAGELACASGVAGGPLSDSPRLPLEFGDGGFTSIYVGHRVFAQHRDDTLCQSTQGTRDAGAATLEAVTRFGAGPFDQFTDRCVLRGRDAACFNVEDGGTNTFQGVVSLANSIFTPAVVTEAGQVLDTIDGRVVGTGALAGSIYNCIFPTDGGLFCSTSQRDLPGPRRLDSLNDQGGCFVTPGFEAHCFSGSSPMQRMPTRFGVRLVSGSANIGCAVTGASGVQCWGFGVRFKNVVIDEPVTQLSVTGRSAAYDVPVACVLTQSGRVLCWGGNRYGELGSQPGDDRNVELVTQ